MGVPIAPLFSGQTLAGRVANQIFVDSFEITLSITINEVSDAMTASRRIRIFCPLGGKDDGTDGKSDEDGDFAGRWWRNDNRHH